MSEMHNLGFDEISKPKSEINEYRKIQPEENTPLEEAIKIFDNFFAKEFTDCNSETKEETENNNEVEGNYFSTYDERLKQTPAQETDRGEWEGKRGESKFIPSGEKIKETLAKYGLDSIIYNNAIPDFSECSESTVEIDDMSDIRAKNFQQCDEKCAEQWNKEGRDGRTDWTPRDIEKWRKANGYSWHERNDMKTCDLVPTEINDYFGHLGGVSECKKRDAASEGDEFDE